MFMAQLQHKEARKLLGIIQIAIGSKEQLTYLTAAERMGRMPPQQNARAVAQMCDLLDAAACLAGRPLLALVAVRQSTGEINPMAWKKEFGPQRDAIIQRSLDHRFESADYAAISSAIDDLGGRGNVKAWKYLEQLYPGELLYRRLIEAYTADQGNAVDDLGSDAPDRAKSEGWSYPRDPGVRNAVILRARGRCEYCDELGFLKKNGSRYLEAHHIIALANEGADRITNVIALCPSDHRRAHFGQDAEVLEKAMMLKVAAKNTVSL